MMPLVTAVILACFAVYSLAWYGGAIEGDFSLLLFVATVVSGLYWLVDRLVFAPRRHAAVASLQSDWKRRNADLADQGIAPLASDDSASAKEKLMAQPWWLDWTAGLFPVILLVFLLRSFIFEPFKIPSGSMIPTLHIGDMILVNKFHYGLRLPVLNKKLTQGKSVQRGDVFVFRFPPQPSVDYIKRVVGLPGDEVAYLDKRLTINGQPVSEAAQPEYFDSSTTAYFTQFKEQLGDKPHNIIINDRAPAFIGRPQSFPHRDDCVYSVEGVRCTVPAGHYFAMGDNRDNSLDSRYWGFVPDENIVGKAFFIWMNFGDFGRIGRFH